MLPYVLDQKTPILDGYISFHPSSNNTDVNSLISMKKSTSYNDWKFLIVF